MPSPPDRYAATARAVARSVLRAPPFVQPRRAPGLFARVADDVGHGIVAAARWSVSGFRTVVAHPVGHVATSLFGSASTLVLIAAAVAAVVVASVLWVRRSRPGRGAPDDAGVHGERHDRRSAALLARAVAARDAGDLDLALRLRFEAGLEQLEASGVVRERSTLTTAAIAAQVRSRTFDDLASVHTLVAYGGVEATGDEVAAAFERWPEVRPEARPPAGAR